MAADRGQWKITEVLERVDLAELLDELTTAAGSGRYRRWHCPAPDHDDHRPSVTMFVDRTGHERWKCWSGDPSHRGDALDLVTVATGRGRGDGLDWLADRARMIPDQPLPPVRTQPPPPRPTVLDPAVTQYVQTCARILWTRTGAPVREWLHQRGLDDTILRAHQVGADPGRAMLPRRKGLPRGTVPAAVFPALDPAGHGVTYVQARYLEPDRVGVKYDNPSIALGPNPRLAWCTPTRPAAGNALVVVEGIPDALVAAQGGFRAVGLLGAQSPDDRVAAAVCTVARAEQRRVVIVPDRDDAGRYAARLLGELLRGFDVDARTVEPGCGADLSDWARLDPAWPHHIIGRAPAGPGSPAEPSRTDTRIRRAR